MKLPRASTPLAALSEPEPMPPCSWPITHTKYSLPPPMIIPRTTPPHNNLQIFHPTIYSTRWWSKSIQRSVVSKHKKSNQTTTTHYSDFSFANQSLRDFEVSVSHLCSFIIHTALVQISLCLLEYIIILCINCMFKQRSYQL